MEWYKNLSAKTRFTIEETARVAVCVAGVITIKMVARKTVEVLFDV